MLITCFLAVVDRIATLPPPKMSISLSLEHMIVFSYIVMGELIRLQMALKWLIS